MFKISFVRNSDFIEWKDKTDMRNLKFPSRFYTQSDLIYNYESRYILKNTMGCRWYIENNVLLEKINNWFFWCRENGYYTEEHPWNYRQ